MEVDVSEHKVAEVDQRANGKQTQDEREESDTYRPWQPQRLSEDWCCHQRGNSTNSGWRGDIDGVLRVDAQDVFRVIRREGDEYLAQSTGNHQVAEGEKSVGTC